MSNRLIHERSPYLLQHADNPVDWYPWGEEAFKKAAGEDKPIFLSIGYSTCHWCHVMAHESFENEEIAGILNRYFVSVKVDREERPDVDSVYMSVCQLMTGNGGWPMSIFLTPEQKAFFAGTYFPPDSRYGMPGFRELLLAVAKQWRTDRSQLVRSADRMISEISVKDRFATAERNAELPQKAAGIFTHIFDQKYGGYGNAPKFPVPHNLIFLTLFSAIYKNHSVFDQVKITLENMRKGGIFDQIGYGFSRYSTDRFFLVPHFEKMLYDNALLILAYTAAYKFSGEQMLLDTAEKTADYIFREMTGGLGEFFSAQDADSEGTEGKYYVWDYDEICKILGDKIGPEYCRHFNITREGNFEGKNIPNLLNSNAPGDAFEAERRLLYEYRKKRFDLHLDRKVLTSWNALMICALIVLYRVSGKHKYLDAATKNQQFIKQFHMTKHLLCVSSFDRKQSGNGFLDDYACYAAALLCLHDVTGKQEYLSDAEQILEEAQAQFADAEGAGYYLNGTQNDTLFFRPRETYDGALPSGNSVMAYCLVRMAQKKEILQYEESLPYRKRAEKQLAFLSQEAEKNPAGHSMFLIALLYDLYPPRKITAVLSNEKKENVMQRLPLYSDVTILSEFDEEHGLLNGKTTYYVCEGHNCLPPTNSL